MSPTIPSLGHVQRKYKLEDHYGVRKNREIALMCGIHLRTLHRDIKKWKASGEYDEWLDQKWHYYLESDTVDDRTKFIQLTRLKERRIKRQITQEIDVNIKHDITNLLSQYEQIFEPKRVETQPIQNNNSKE